MSRIIMPGNYDTEGDFCDALFEEEEAARAAEQVAEDEDDSEED